MSKHIAKLFKEHKITEAIMTFSCGGDSMNETSFEYNTEDGSEVPANIKSELTSYFDEIIYDKVEFYVNSDGHYEGESGTVTISLNAPVDEEENTDSEEDDDDDSTFYYVKDSEEEYNESFTESDVAFPITAVQKKFIELNISNINGGDGALAVNFKRDFIMDDKQDKMLEEFKDKLQNFMGGREPECEYEGSLNEGSPTFTTNDEGKVLTIVGNNLIFEVHYRATVYKKDGEIVEQ